MKHFRNLANWLCCTAAFLFCGMSTNGISVLSALAHETAQTTDFSLAQISWEQNGELLTPCATDADGDAVTLPETAMDAAADALRGAESSDETETQLPTFYSLLDVDGESYITSVKDQGASGLCWAYAAIGACESNILTQGLTIPEEWLSDEGELDLSEASLAWYIYTERMQLGDLASGDYLTLDGKGVGGGNATIASFAMAAGIGTQLEQYLPMSDWDEGYSEYQRYTSYYEMESSDIIWELEEGAEDLIKQWIVETGAVSASYYSSGTYYDNGTSSAYYQTRYGSNNADHAVLIVGWDDDYSAENFQSGTQPERDGAWLVRNSWGTDDYGGYFWMSYDEPSLCELARFEMTEVQDQEIRYQYDGGASYSGIVSSAAANVFTAETDCTLSSVMFPISSLSESHVRYTISIYLLGDDAQTPEDGTLLYTTAGITTYSGYKNIALDTPVAIQKGETFAVVLSLGRVQATDSRPYTTIESNMEDSVASVQCLVREGQSYIQDSAGSWYDIVDLQSMTNSSGVLAYADLGNVALKVIAEASETENNTAQLEAALSYGATDETAGELYQLAYAAAIALPEDVAQWEIDNAAANLLAGLEQDGLIQFPKLLYLSHSYLRGDVDLDDTVTILDAHEALLAYSQESVGILATLLPAQVAAADIDESGTLSIWDAYWILLYYASESAGMTPDWETLTGG